MKIIKNTLFCFALTLSLESLTIASESDEILCSLEDNQDESIDEMSDEEFGEIIDDVNTCELLDDLNTCEQLALEGKVREYQLKFYEKMARSFATGGALGCFVFGNRPNCTHATICSGLLLGDAMFHYRVHCVKTKKERLDAKCKERTKNPVVANYLGECYEKGHCLKHSPELAVSYYHLAANEGYQPAINNLARYYREGIGVYEVDIEEVEEPYPSLGDLIHKKHQE